MRYGLSVPTFGELSDPLPLARFAAAAEVAGWDGFFVWDHLQWSGEADGMPRGPVADTTVALSLIAAATNSIRIGPMVTPLARRRPWKVAREIATLDRMTAGRITLGVGLGAPAGLEFSDFGEDADSARRAQLLDEALDILRGLWGGGPFSYNGRHHRLAAVQMQPLPVQQPMPIWVAGEWPGPKAPFRRAAKNQGVYPMLWSLPAAQQVSAIRELIDFSTPLRVDDAEWDVVYGVETSATELEAARDTTGTFAEAGVSWWMEPLGPWRGPIESLRARIDAGPPA